MLGELNDSVDENCAEPRTLCADFSTRSQQHVLHILIIIQPIYESMLTHPFEGGRSVITDRQGVGPICELHIY